MAFKEYLNNCEFIERTKESWNKEGFNHGIFFGIDEEIYHSIGQETPVTEEQEQQYREELITDPEFKVTQDVMDASWVIKV